MDSYILILTTVPDKETGSTLARMLVERRLAACATLSDSVLSFYWWKETLTEDREFILLIKTRESLYPSLEKALEEAHPYEVPEIIALPVARGSGNYLDWISRETASAET